MRRVTDRGTRWSHAAAGVALAFAFVAASPSHAQLTITCLEVGPDVVCTSPGGPISLSGLTLTFTGGNSPHVSPTIPSIQIGPLAGLDFYAGATPPSALWRGPYRVP